MSEIKVVLFDLGKVLVDFDHLRAAERISSFCKRTPLQIYNLFFESQVTIDFEAGKISPQNFYLKVKEMLDLDLSFNSFIPIWNDIFFLSPKNRSVYRLINILRANYETALLSNINTLHYEYLKEKFPVFGVFDKIFLSFEMGLIKPDKEIYKKVIGELKVRAQEIFYTDDRQELVESAASLGMKAKIFVNFAQLMSDLEEAGIIFTDEKNRNKLPSF
ncbi:MAG: HAD hydrolase-like protein [Candidatus Omnitrophica bacterium]|jgi:putative hydrolase of the HAD superfamily|nr:HAD hydrolase-like protein [Candidatus Omnitrophota bacterium]